MSARSTVYYELVKGPDDVVGALAYALYKTDKSEFIKAFASKNQREPSDAELEPFMMMSGMATTLQSYKDRAESLLENFLDEVLATELLQQQMNLKTEAVVVAVNQKFGFWRGVGQNVIAGIATSIITFGLIFSAWMYSEGPDKILVRAAVKFTQPEPAMAGEQPRPQNSEISPK